MVQGLQGHRLTVQGNVSGFLAIADFVEHERQALRFHGIPLKVHGCVYVSPEVGRAPLSGLLVLTILPTSVMGEEEKTLGGYLPLDNADHFEIG
jgi:hypothetical protein